MALLHHVTWSINSICTRYDSGVLRIKLPVAEQAKPRKISVGSSDNKQRQIAS